MVADAQPLIAALPPGGTFDGKNETWVCPDGVWITRPLTIVNSPIFVKPTSDPTKLPDQDGQKQELGVKPVVRVQNTTEVNLGGTTVVGSNTATGYHANLVGEHGFEILQSSKVTMENAQAKNVHGDGVIFDGAIPCSDVVVNGLTVTLTGRMGMTVASLVNSALCNLAIGSVTEEPVDFESDVANRGSGNVTVTNLATSGGLRHIEALSGPITYQKVHLSGGHVVVADRAGVSGQLVTLSQGTIVMPKRLPLGAVYLDGGAQVVIEDVDFTGNAQVFYVQMPSRYPGAQATQGSKLTLSGCTKNGRRITPLDGYVDASSQVVIE